MGQRTGGDGATARPPLARRDRARPRPHNLVGRRPEAYIVVVGIVRPRQPPTIRAASPEVLFYHPHDCLRARPRLNPIGVELSDVACRLQPNR